MFPIQLLLVIDQEIRTQAEQHLTQAIEAQYVRFHPFVCLIANPCILTISFALIFVFITLDSFVWISRDHFCWHYVQNWLPKVNPTKHVN